jgi:hypothetical protein
MSWRDDPDLVIACVWDEGQMVYRVSYRDDLGEWVECGIAVNQFEVQSRLSHACYQVAA